MASAAVDRVCSKVSSSLRSAGDGWVGRCPAHDDQHQSLSINEGTDGRALVKCHAGCAVTDVLRAMGLTFPDLFVSAQPAREPSRVFVYKDAIGQTLYEVCRFTGKDFRQRRPDGHGGWLWNLTGVTKVPYRLPDLQNIPAVVVVEGEKDVETLWSHGIPATCNSGGAGKWKSAETLALKRAGCMRVIIIPDNDDPGRSHAEAVAVQCRRAGMGVSVVELPGLGPHGDISDWLAAGHTRDELEALFNRPHVVPASGVVPPAGPPAVGTDATLPMADPSRFHLTDLGNAEAFIAHFGNRVRYDHDSEKWCIWRDHAWVHGAKAEVRELAHQHVLLWQIEAAATGWTTDWVKRQKLIDFTSKLEKSGSFSSMLTEVQVKPSIRVHGGWDADPWLLGCPNGVYNLRTNEFRAGLPEDRISKQLGVPYDAAAECPRWLHFLYSVFDGDSDLVKYIQRTMGYCLTGITTEQCFFMAYGRGSNGKSTFLVTLDRVFGDYAHTTDVRTFTLGNDGVVYELAQLNGRRLILTSEAKTRTALNEQVLKNFTGGEKIEAQHKYGHPFSYRPVGKIWFAVNHMPKVEDESVGFWRRVRMIPFTRTFPQDRTFGERLLEEVPGILNWAIEGCRIWQADGLNAPASVVSATEAYQQAEDPVQGFIDEKCIVGPEFRCSASGLYQSYASWARANGVDKPLTGNDFGRHVAGKYEKRRETRGNFYIGIAPRQTDGMYAEREGE